MSDPRDTAAAETERVIRSGTIWTAAGVLAPVIGLSPLAAAGWRPWRMPVPLDVLWWVGAGAAGVGLALLVWAGCPALGFALEDAHRQKVRTIRPGIVLDVAGLTLAGFAILLSPPL